MKTAENSIVRPLPDEDPPLAGFAQYLLRENVAVFFISSCFSDMMESDQKTAAIRARTLKPHPWTCSRVMNDSKQNSYTVPAQPILDLVKELTVGQRSADTLEQLAIFLHSRIFSKLGPFFIEIYFPDHAVPGFTPQVLAEGAKSGRHVPPLIPADHPLLEEPRRGGRPVELCMPAPLPDFLAATGNATHLIVPIVDGPELFGLLYFGCADPCSFSSPFLDSLQTLAAIIGSRLKSMTAILQLKESMEALEHSERLRTALYEISEQAHHADNIADLYAKMHRIVGRLIHAKNFFIALVEERGDGRYITFPYFVDTNDPHFHGLEIKLDQEQRTITGYLLETRRPLLLTPENFTRICRDYNIRCIGTPPHSWLGAPFYLEDLAGAVAVQSYGNIVYTEKNKELMAFVARHIGDVLKQKRAVDAFRKAKDRAEMAEKNKSNFLANMSHEIRTPMNGIIGLTELVLKSDISGYQRTYLEMVHSSADRLLKLINDILDFSKIEAGKLELKITPFGLRHTITDSLEILAIGAAKKGIALIVDCAEDVPDQLLGDAGKLHQILTNLVGNGLKFTHQGSVTLTVRPSLPLPKISDPVDLSFRIADTGIGIPKNEIPHIFEAFNQLGTTRDANQQGTGLGLVIAAELVEMMGGKIRAESHPGVGTTFYFSARFPLAPPATAAQPTPVVEKRKNRQSLHILLVEDEYINRTLAVSVLEREGWEVTVAENGIQSLELLDHYGFDLILMDIQMPELNGYETTRIIRRKEKQNGRHIPIIAMTAYAVVGDREKCLDAGMDGYISKPIHPDRLLDEIESVLHRSPNYPN